MNYKEIDGQLKELLLMTKTMGASDLHITVGTPPVLRIDGLLRKLEVTSLSLMDTERLAKALLYNEKLINKFKENGEVDFAFQLNDIGRYRVSVYRQKGGYAVALRSIPSQIPSMERLGLPLSEIKEMANNSRGLVLVTGPTGSGKSTTLASMVQHINYTRKCHILTLEDPIEYVHEHEQSIVSQREIGVDTQSYDVALRAALRADPDVILVGEMRDAQTIATAITAAETGHLVLSSLHTLGASQTIDRIIDVFKPEQQEQIKTQLANILKGVMSQQLLPRMDSPGRCLAYEIMLNTPAISHLIREGKSYQINSHIQIGRNLGMKTMDASLVDLYKQGKITWDQVLKHAVIPEETQRMLKMS